MRIAILSSEFPPGPGGIGTHAYQIGKNLCATGNPVMVITPQDYASRDEVEAFNRRLPFQIVRLRHLNPSIVEAFYRMAVVQKSIQGFKPQITITTGERSAWVFAVLSQLHRYRWAAVGHGTEFGGRLNWEKRLTRWAFNQASGVVSVSGYTRKRMESLGIRANHLVVIPNGADGDQFMRGDGKNPKQVLDQYGIPVDATVLLTVGNVTERKGQEVVLRALSEVLRERPNVHYIMAGLPTNQIKLTQIAAGLGILDHVHFLGRVSQDQLVELYQACDLFLMTSRHTIEGDFEGFGIAVIEAALCGKPAIVSRGSGLEEAVIDGVTGIYVPENDPHGTGIAICALVNSKEERERMGKNAYERARCQNTWQIVTQKYLSFLQMVTASR